MYGKLALRRNLGGAWLSIVILRSASFRPNSLRQQSQLCRCRAMSRCHPWQPLLLSCVPSETIDLWCAAPFLTFLFSFPADGPLPARCKQTGLGHRAAAHGPEGCEVDLHQAADLGSSRPRHGPPQTQSKRFVQRTAGWANLGPLISWTRLQRSRY